MDVEKTQDAPPLLARKVPFWLFRILWKRTLDIFKSFYYFWTLSWAHTFAVTSLFLLYSPCTRSKFTQRCTFLITGKSKMSLAFLSLTAQLRSLVVSRRIFVLFIHIWFSILRKNNVYSFSRVIHLVVHYVKRAKQVSQSDHFHAFDFRVPRRNVDNSKPDDKGSSLKCSWIGWRL